jgi:UDP:flavonoid glycosyltransferase YjiC (YdhE family)
VRVLAATTRGAGHFGPLAPFARACVDAGHEVRVAVPRQSLALVERAGLEPWPLDDPDQDELDRVFGRVPSLPPEEQNRLVLREVFGRIHTTAHLPGILAAVEQWRPELVLRELNEYASAIAAERAALPQARVAISLAGLEEEARTHATAALAEARAAEPAIARSPMLTLVPPSLEHPTLPTPADVRRFRERPSAERATLPDWWPGDERPLVYVTFGSVAPTLGFFAALLRALVATLGTLDARVLLTLGEEADPAVLESVPPNVHVERWVPQADVLPVAAAVVCHGGFGSTLGALCAGVPLVVLPLFADQPLNASRVAALGAGVALEGGPAALAALPDAVQTVLGDPGYTASAGRVAAEARALPPVEEAVSALEEIAGG